jgi:hypothetical protein
VRVVCTTRDIGDKEGLLSWGRPEAKAPALPGLTERTTTLRRLNATLTSVQLGPPPLRIHCDCPQAGRGVSVIPSCEWCKGAHRKSANLLCRCRYPGAVGSLTTIQFGSGDRSSPIRIGGPCGREIPLNSDRQLRKTIDDLRELERRCFASRSRFAFYGYLAAVFQLYVQLRRKNQAKSWARRIAKLFGFRKQKRSHCIRVLIDATSSTDLKTKSRWSRALRYAWRERKTWKELGSFLRENGGPAGCADQFATINSVGKYPGCIVYRRPGTGRPYLIVHEGISGVK